MPVNVFIDTSVFLSFYTVSKNDLDQMEKLIGLISEGRIKIYVTSQVEREWLRNRDNKIAEAIKLFEGKKFQLRSVSRFMFEYEEILHIKYSLEIAENARLKAISKAKNEAITASTSADKLMLRIFSAAGVGLKMKRSSIELSTD